MANAFILFGGTVKQSTNVSAVGYQNSSGFAQTFVINETKYTHTYTVSNQVSTVTAGYYQEIPFLKWLATDDPDSNLNAYILPTNSLSDAVKNDQILISKLTIDPSHNDFCTVDHYSWKYDPAIKVYDDATGEIIMPAPGDPNLTITSAPKSVSTVAHNFYDKNFPLIVSSDFHDNVSDGLYALALCALNIERIISDIFPIFSDVPELAAYITTQENEWSFGQIFNQPEYTDIKQYWDNLENYYRAVYDKSFYIKTQPGANKLIWLASVLSASGLALFSLEDKIKVLNQILDIIKQATLKNLLYPPGVGVILSNPLDKIASLGPQLILNITASVVESPTQTDAFLKSLLKVTYTDVFSTDHTLYELLYNILSDNRIGIYTLGLINQNEDRKQFVESMYNIWKLSKYYPYYEAPDYTQPANPKTGVFQESFFIVNRTQYYSKNTAPSVLSFKATDTSVETYIINYKYDFKSTQVVAYQEITSTNTASEHQNTITIPYLFGTYHLYQPVTLVGFTQNTVVNVPEKACIPIFYLKYADDAKKIKDFDIGLLSFAELALNLVLTFTGVGEVQDLSYLVEISDIGEVTLLPESQVVLTWDNFLGVNKTVMLTAGSFNAITQYIAAKTENQDPQVQAVLKALNIFLGAVTLASTSIDIVGQIATANAAFNVRAAADGLSQDNEIPGVVMDAINPFADITLLSSEMVTKLSGLPTDATNIISRFNVFSDEDKINFYCDFYDLANTDSAWSKLNTVYNTTGVDRTLVDDWQEIETLTSYRSNINFIESYSAIRNDTKLLTHINIGDFGVDINGDAWVTGGHNQALLLFPDNQGIIRWRFANPNEVTTNLAGYRRGFVERNMSDLNWSGGAPPSPWKLKKIRNSFWPLPPPSGKFDAQRIQEEMALANSNKIFDKTVFKKTKTISYYIGTASDGQNIQVQINPITNSIISIYPIDIF